MKNQGLAPVLCNAGSGSIHHHYFGCPVCGSEGGGFTISGDGEDDWGTHEDIMVEYRQLQTVMNMLKAREILHDLSDYDNAAADFLKIDRVQHYEKISEELGCIKD